MSRSLRLDLIEASSHSRRKLRDTAAGIVDATAHGR